MASSTSINVADTTTEGKGRAAATGTVATTTAFKAMKVKGGWKRGLAIFDFFLRLFAIAAALAAAAAMGTTDQTLPFFTQFFQFQASFDDLPALTFFVIGNAIAGGYLVLSLPFSIVSIVRPHAMGPRFLLFTFDTIMLALSTASASAAAAIVYLAHEGNSSANWNAICQQFQDFCQQISGAVVASFIAAVIFMLLVVMSTLALRKP